MKVLIAAQGYFPAKAYVYEGNCFDNIRLNEFVQNLQYILV